MFQKLFILVALGALVSAVDECMLNGVLVENDHVADLTNCANYYWCGAGGVPHVLSCPVVGTTVYLFNPDVKKCDSAYVCALPAANPCPATGITKVAVEGSCTDYTLCIDGDQYPKVCGTGLAFSATAQNCVLAADAGCVENLCATITTAPKMYPDTADCMAYYICDKLDVPTKYVCPTGLIYDEATQECIVGECTVV